MPLQSNLKQKSENKKSSKMKWSNKHATEDTRFDHNLENDLKTKETLSDDSTKFALACKCAASKTQILYKGLILIMLLLLNGTYFTLSFVPNFNNGTNQPQPLILTTSRKKIK